MFQSAYSPFGSFFNRTELENLQKTLQAGGSPGSLMIRENLSNLIVKLTQRATPFADAVISNNAPGAGKATVYDRQTVLGTMAAADLFFAETGLPADDDATYEQITVPYKAFGKGKSLTEFMRRASKSFFGNGRDAEAECTESALMEYMQGLEKALWYGDYDAGARPNQWDGILKTIPSANKIDDNEAPTTNSIVAMINKMVRIIMNKGGSPTGVYMTHGGHQRLNVELNPGSTVILSPDANRISAGVLVDSITTPAGKLPIKATTHLVSTACTGGNTGKYKSSIVVVDEKNIAFESLAFAEKVYLPVATMLGDKFVIFTFGAPLWKAPVWCGEIQNVLECDV